MTKAELAERAGLKVYDTAIPQDIFNTLTEEEQRFGVWCYDNDKIFGEYVNLKRHHYKDIPAEYIIKHIKAWMENADPDAIVMMSENLFGGKWSISPDCESYRHHPDDSSCGVFNP